MPFKFCPFCKRDSWIKEGKCLSCEEVVSRICTECGEELIPHEKDLCSGCVSSREHAGDLGWTV